MVLLRTHSQCHLAQTVATGLSNVIMPSQQPKLSAARLITAVRADILPPSSLACIGGSVLWFAQHLIFQTMGGVMTATRIATRRIRVKPGMRISFLYQKLNGDMRTVNNFLVDNIYVSQRGHRIVQGYREDNEGRSYRRGRMTNVVEIKTEKQIAS